MDTISALWYTMTTGSVYQRIQSGDLIFGMFFISLIWIFIYEKDKDKKFMLGVYSLVFAGIYYFPLTAYIILRIAIDRDSFFRMFWLLPIMIVIPYVLTRLEEKVVKRFRIWFLISVTVFLVFRGETAYSLMIRSENVYSLPNIVIEVVERINEDVEELDMEAIQVLFPEEFLPFVRQYDASILVPIGGPPRLFSNFLDRANENIQDLYMAMRVLDRAGGDVVFFTFLKEEEINYLVLWKYHALIDFLYGGIEVVDTIGEYVIFRINDFSQECAVFQGIDYRSVFDYFYYIENYDDVIASVGIGHQEVLEHFVTIGIPEGRRGNRTFDVSIYMSNYPELYCELGEEYILWFEHFMEYGDEQQKIANRLFPILDEINYDNVFRYSYFMSRYPELAERFETPDDALEFFVSEGMDLGLQGSPFFDVHFFKENRDDLYALFGDDLRQYYMHFVIFGDLEHERSRAFRQPREIHGFFNR